MRRYLLLVPMIALTAARLFAQEADAAPKKQGARLGIKVAPGLAWFRSDEKELEGDGSRVAFTWGLMCDVPLSPNGSYALHVGLFQNSIGGKFTSAYTQDDAAVVGAYDLALTYLEVPLALRMRTTMDKPLNFYGLLGVSSAVNLKAKGDYSTTVSAGGSSVTTTYEDENVTDEVAAFKCGLQVGAGAEYDISNLTLVLGITYNSCFTNVLDKDAKKLFGNGEKRKMLADYLELTVGLFF